MVLDGHDELRWTLGLDRVRQALEHLGHPENAYRQILVGGTNGKGSTCMYLERMLMSKGYRVGTTLSPHVSTFQERFRIDSHNAQAAEIAVLERELKPGLSDIDLTYFEWTVVLACAFFAREKTDYGIFEIGLGGRLDAANVLNPNVSIITNIALDHTDYLGPSTSHIAREKAAIARAGRPLITAATDGLDVIRAHARDVGARLTEVTEPLSLPTGITGPQQGLNAALAYASATALGISLTENELAYALNTAFLPGRIERVGKIILDVAHNPASMQSLVSFLAASGFQGAAVFGVLADKDYQSMTRMLAQVCPLIFIAPAQTPRSWQESDMEAIQSFSGIIRCASITEALNRALQQGVNVVVTGSFYTIGEVRDSLICQGYAAYY